MDSFISHLGYTHQWHYSGVYHCRRVFLVFEIHMSEIIQYKYSFSLISFFQHLSLRFTCAYICIYMITQI